MKTDKKISGLLIDHSADTNFWGSYYEAPFKKRCEGLKGKTPKNATVLFSAKERSQSFIK